MANYRRLYHFFVCGIDDALTLLERGEPLRARELLQKTLLDAEEHVVSDAPLPKQEILPFPQN